MTKNIEEKEEKVDPTKVKYFTTWVKNFQEGMGLINYDITVIAEYMDERGAIDVDECGRLATISYSIDWISCPSTTFMDINRTAFHEVAELCFNKIRILLERHYSFDVVKEIIHDVIVRLENTLWKEWTKNIFDEVDYPIAPSPTVKVDDIDPDSNDNECINKTIPVKLCTKKENNNGE